MLNEGVPNVNSPERYNMKAFIVSNEQLQNDYYRIRFDAPEMAAKSGPGQFVHVRIDERNDNILRRPFSIHNAENGIITVVYKVVGTGTERLKEKLPGDSCDLIGPVGVGFSTPDDDVIPVAVCGGYGAAATFMLTQRSKQPGVLLLGARSEADIILTRDYEERGFEVKVATDDGSMGHKGRVTELIDQLLAEKPGKKFFFYGCGPHPMLMALAKILKARGLDGELSIDHFMCCGVGACFGCVVKIAAPETADGWVYKRSCVDGPVFKLADVYAE